MDAEIIAACTGARLDRAQCFAAALTDAMQQWGIDTPVRQAAFLPNVGVESGHLVYVREIWGPTDAQTRYEGRRDLGNLRPGDGRRFAGRGLIQVTGRANYAAARDGMRRRLASVPDFEASPELLESTTWAAQSACWFWAANGINPFADAGDFDGVCDKINRGRKTAAIGDSNGWAERKAFWAAAKAALGVQA